MSKRAMPQPPLTATGLCVWLQNPAFSLLAAPTVKNLENAPHEFVHSHTRGKTQK